MTLALRGRLSYALTTDEHRPLFGRAMRFEATIPGLEKI
jgi:hypothetical protein